MNKNQIVYVPLAVDILHSGHLNVIKKVKKIWQGCYRTFIG